MAEIQTKFDKDGNVVGYKIIAYLGRDEKNKKVRRSITIAKPEGLTPKRLEKEVARIADEWEREQRQAYETQDAHLKDDIRKEKRTIKVAEFIDSHWLKKHVNDGNHTPDTIAFYGHMADGIKAYFKENKPNLKVSDVGKGDVLDFLFYLRNDARKKDGEKYSSTTIQHYFSTLRNILEYAVYIEYLKDDPCKKIKQTDRPRREDHEIDFLTDEDAIRFMACLESDVEKQYWEKAHMSYLYWKALLSTMIVTGLRRGELVGLQWRDIDKKQMVLSVRRNVTINVGAKEEKRSDKKIHIGELKGKRTRRVPITKSIVDLLDQLKEETKEKYKTIDGEDYIFCRADDSKLPIYPTEPTRQLKKFIKRHGLPDVSPHDLRHTAASLAIQSGANIKEIQKLLGHRDPATTLKFYAGITEKAERRTIEGIEGMLKKKEDN